MNRHCRQRPARRRLVAAAAAALVLLTLSAAWEGPARAAGPKAAAIRPAPIDNAHLGGQSGRDIQRQAEQRSVRRDLRRIQRNGFGPTVVLRRTATARAPRAGGGHGFTVLIVLALCVLLALPMIASRVSSRST